MARMRTEFEDAYPKVAEFLREALRAAAADADKLRKFQTWSGLSEEEARRTLERFSSPPWIDVGDAGVTPGGSAARGVFDPTRSTIVKLAEDIAQQFERDFDQERARTLLEATVLHELVHWGYASTGKTEGPQEERGVEFERACYGDTQRRYPPLVRGKFPVAAEAPGAEVVSPGIPAAAPGAGAPPTERTIKAIVNIFETGLVLGDYSAVTLLEGDSGGLTYGRSQTTLNSGGLAKLIDRYCADTGVEWAGELARYQARLGDADRSLEADGYFKNLLRAAADDPLMRAAQDRFFDEAYWQPASAAAASARIATPLGVAVVYDSFVHGSWPLMRRRTNEAVGELSAIGERAWVAAYVDTRLGWLANNSKAVLRTTVYRMQAFQRLIAQAAWNLPLPLVVRDVEINAPALAGEPQKVYSGPPVGSRVLTVTEPLTRGRDVRRVQLALSRPPNRRDVVADGVFGPGTRGTVGSFQRDRGLAPTGVVDAPTLTALDVAVEGAAMSDVEEELTRQIAGGRIVFDTGSEPRLRRQLLRQNAGLQIVPGLQRLVLELSRLVSSSIRISSIIRDDGDSHHGTGRAVDIGNEEIATELLPKIATEAKVAELGIDELIFDATVAGRTNPDEWNFDQGVRHAYNTRTLLAHRDHIHVSVKT